MTEDILYFNGIDGASGEYLIPPMTPEQISEIVRGEPRDAEQLQELKWWRQRRVTEATWALRKG